MALKETKTNEEPPGVANPLILYMGFAAARRRISDMSTDLLTARDEQSAWHDHSHCGIVCLQISVMHNVYSVR